MDVECGALHMPPGLTLTRAATAASLGAALLAPVRLARAQQAAQSACVSAIGPDSAVSPNAQSAARIPDTTHVALRILASVSADEVRFVGTPKLCVRLTGDAQLDSVRIVARRNLASPVVSNATYRNVYVAVEILGRLNAECISARITGAARDSSRTMRCAALNVQGTRGAPPSGTSVITSDSSTPPAVPPRR